MVQQKFHYGHHKYEVHDRENLRHDLFEGITDIVITHVKQDCIIEAIFQ